MKTFNLQMFASPVQGSKIVYLLRVLKDAAKEDAAVLALQTEGSTSISKDADTVATKQGTIRVPGPAEIGISLTSILDGEDERIEGFEEASLNGEIVEVWEVNMAKKDDSGKYATKYSRGYITSFEKSANSEDFVEVSMEIGVYGMPQKGVVSLTTEQEEAALYAFTDNKKTAA